MEQKELTDKDYTEVVVNKGNKLKLEFIVNEPGKMPILSWEFRTADYDIKFGVLSEDIASGEKRSEIDLGTVSSNEMDEIGFINTRPNTKCMLTCCLKL